MVSLADRVAVMSVSRIVKERQRRYHRSRPQNASVAKQFPSKCALTEGLLRLAPAMTFDDTTTRYDDTIACAALSCEL